MQPYRGRIWVTDWGHNCYVIIRVTIGAYRIIMSVAVQRLHIPSHRQLACFLLDKSSIANVHLANHKLIVYVSPYNILLIFKAPCCEELLEDAVSIKIMLKLKSYSQFKYTCSGIIAEAHSGKLEATPSEVQQCRGQPSGPNIVFLKICGSQGKKGLIISIKV